MLIFAPYFLIEYWTLNLYMHDSELHGLVCTQYLYYNKGLYRCASKYLLRYICRIHSKLLAQKFRQSHFDSLSFAFNMDKF